MKTFITLAALSLLLSNSSFAGPGSGHSHGPQKIAECKAKECTKKEIREAVLSRIIPSFISRKKLADHWSEAEVKSMKQKEFKGKLEWVLQIYNKLEIERKKNLYVFVSPGGFLKGINHTGK